MIRIGSDTDIGIDLIGSEFLLHNIYIAMLARRCGRL